MFPLSESWSKQMKDSSPWRKYLLSVNSDSCMQSEDEENAKYIEQRSKMKTIHAYCSFHRRVSAHVGIRAACLASLGGQAGIWVFVRLVLASSRGYFPAK